jgi:hypothetical protein
LIDTFFQAEKIVGAAKWIKRAQTIALRVWLVGQAFLPVQLFFSRMNFFAK